MSDFILPPSEVIPPLKIIVEADIPLRAQYKVTFSIDVSQSKKCNFFHCIINKFQKLEFFNYYN